MTIMKFSLNIAEHDLRKLLVNGVELEEDFRYTPSAMHLDV
jgi:hypothetical protein